MVNGMMLFLRQKMVDICKTSMDMPDKGLLECLIDMFGDEEKQAILVEYQEDLLTLIKVSDQYNVIKFLLFIIICNQIYMFNKSVIYVFIIK